MSTATVFCLFLPFILQYSKSNLSICHVFKKKTTWNKTLPSSYARGKKNCGRLVGSRDALRRALPCPLHLSSLFFLSRHTQMQFSVGRQSSLLLFFSLLSHAVAFFSRKEEEEKRREGGPSSDQKRKKSLKKKKHTHAHKERDMGDRKKERKKGRKVTLLL